MTTSYKMLPSEYGDLQVLFFLDETTGDWFMDEASLMSMAKIERTEFATLMNRADYRQTSKGRWIVSLIDAYLMLPEKPRDWVFEEHLEYLPLRLHSTNREDSILLSIRSATRRYLQVDSVSRRSARGRHRAETLHSIARRIEKHVEHLKAFGINERNSVIILDAKTIIEEHRASALV